MNKNNQTAVKLIASALNLDPAGISPKTALGIAPQWDSLAHMRIILALEEEIKRQLTPEEIISITTFNDVKKVLQNR